MAKVMIIGFSGSGKTTSILGNNKYDIKGLNPKETFIIQCTPRSISKPQEYKLIENKIRISNIDKIKHPNWEPTMSDEDIRSLTMGNRVDISHAKGLERFALVAFILSALANSPFRDIVIDDFNYLMQDYYMANSMRGGWDVPKEIGYGMNMVVSALDSLSEKKNVYALAHPEEYRKDNNTIGLKIKTCGNMVDTYITLEGKFDIIIGCVKEDIEGKVSTYFIKGGSMEYPVKETLSVLDDIPDKFPNDLSIVSEALKLKYNQ